MIAKAEDEFPEPPQPDMGGDNPFGEKSPNGNNPEKSPNGGSEIKVEHPGGKISVKSDSNQGKKDVTDERPPDEPIAAFE